MTYEKDGPPLRIVGQFRGFVSGPRELGVDGDSLDGLIVRQRHFFAARGEAVGWKTRGHDTPADSPNGSARPHFVPEDREAVLIERAADMAVREPVRPHGVTLRRVSADAGMRRIAAMESTVWGQDRSWLADDLVGGVAAAPDEIAVHVAEAGGELVSAAWPAFRAGTAFASLGGGSTLAEWRGRGIYRALVATRAALATARGVTYLHVDASDICTWTPPTTARPSCAASASRR